MRELLAIGYAFAVLFNASLFGFSILSRKIVLSIWLIVPLVLLVVSFVGFWVTCEKLDDKFVKGVEGGSRG